VGQVAVAAPGFSADCVETLEELAIRGREVFEEAGGKDYAVLTCLNAGGRHGDDRGSGAAGIIGLGLRQPNWWLKNPTQSPCG
jgi:hypothetical protein